MRCPKCAAENREGRKFCAECGTALKLACTSCGAPNEPAEKFCGDCGAALVVNVPPSAARSPRATSTASDIRITAEQTDASTAADGERKTVTALFADIKGSMELMEDLDPEEARAIVDPALKAGDGCGPSLRRLCRSIDGRRYLRTVQRAGSA